MINHFKYRNMDGNGLQVDTLEYQLKQHLV